MAANPVSEIRKQIDSLDDSIHDLLMKRAELVLHIGEEKRKNNVQVVQTDREIVMIRRLLERHKGPLPREAVVRIWRELVGAVSLLQTGLKVAVTTPDDQSALVYWDMAKDYFSSVLPMQKAKNALAALSLVREGEVTFAVLPWPADEDANPWWNFLMAEDGDRAMRIVARLPLGNRSAEGTNPEHKALVVARLSFDPSGDDRSFIGLELPHNISRGKVVDKATAMGLQPRSLYSRGSGGTTRTAHMLEVCAYVGSGDAKPAELLAALDAPDGRAMALGGYPTPPVYEDKVGKNAETRAKASKKSA